MKRVALITVVLTALTAVTVGGAATLSAPTATTGPVSTVTNASASVSGSVNPGGESTNWLAADGLPTTVATTAAWKTAGSGTSTVSVSDTLSSLTAGTTYHYRVVASNGSGTAHGADGILTTTAPTAPPTASTD